MAFLRSIRPDEDVEFIRGTTLYLRHPALADYAEWSDLRAASRAHLMPWEPAWSHDDLSRSTFRRRLRAYAKDIRDDVSYPYYIFDAALGTMLGGITLSNVRRGSAQTASLGYWMGVHYAGRGHMRTAVDVLLPIAYGPLRLHRLEAATMPRNLASARVLEASGFEREGLARAYLKINGRWEDHLLYSRLSTPAVPKVPLLGGDA